jgi:hypothetical protein
LTAKMAKFALVRDRVERLQSIAGIPFNAEPPPGHGRQRVCHRMGVEDHAVIHLERQHQLLGRIRERSGHLPHSGCPPTRIIRPSGPALERTPLLSFAGPSGLGLDPVALLGLLGLLSTSLRQSRLSLNSANDGSSPSGRMVGRTDESAPMTRFLSLPCESWKPRLSLSVPHQFYTTASSAASVFFAQLCSVCSPDVMMLVVRRRSRSW